MRMTGEQRIAAPRERVWEALNDPDILRRSIPGCQSLEKQGDDRFRAVVEVKIGPIGARFNGLVSLSDVDPPNGYRISGEGQGGTVGSAKGGAQVRLAQDAEGTLLTYDVDAQVSGRLAQLGGPIIDATAKRLAAQFFQRFGDVVGAGAAEPPTMETGPAATAPARQTPFAREAPDSSIPWLIALGVGLIIGFVAGHSDNHWLAMGLFVSLVGVLAFLLGRSLAPGGRS